MCGMDRQSCAVQAKPGCISGGNPFTGALPMQGCQQDAAIVHAFQSMQPLSADILQSRAASEGLRCMALLDFGSTFVARLSRFSRLACQCSSSHGVGPPECQPRIEMDPGKSVGCNFLKSEPDACHPNGEDSLGLFVNRASIWHLASNQGVPRKTRVLTSLPDPFFLFIHISISQSQPCDSVKGL